MNTYDEEQLKAQLKRKFFRNFPETFSTYCACTFFLLYTRTCGHCLFLCLFVYISFQNEPHIPVTWFWVN